MGLLLATVAFFAITSAGASNSMVGSFLYSPFSACDSSGEDGWSSVLQATGLPDANLEASADYSRSAVTRQGSAVLVCGGAEVSQAAISSLGLRLHVAVAQEAPATALYTEGGAVREVVIDQPKSYVDTGSVEQLLDKFIQLDWSDDNGQTWQPLAEISSFDVSGRVVDVALPATDRLVSDIAVQLRPTSFNQEGSSLAVDSIGLTYQVVQPAELKFEVEGQAASKNQLVMPAGRDIQATVNLNSPQSGTMQGLARSLPGIGDEAPAAKISGLLIDAEGEESIVEVEAVWQGTTLAGDLRWSLGVSPPRQLKPGLYTLQTTIEADGHTVSASQEILWGVVAINTAKSSYQPNEPIQFMLSLLDERGATVCDADITLAIKYDGRTVANLTTEDEQIVVTDTCELYGNQLEADYEAWIQLEASGQYDIELTASNEDLSYSTSDTVLVETEPELVINRYGPTRLFPVNNYPMEISIQFNKDFNGSVHEYVPDSFKLVSQPDERPYLVENYDQGKKLVWDITAQSGDNLKLKYTFDPPDVTPAFFTLGKLEITDSTSIFTEPRYWQLAGDAVGRMLLFFDGASTPSGWTCVSCSPGDPFYQNFVRASDTYGEAGGSATHGHTYTSSIGGSNSDGVSENFGSGSVATNAHSHSLSATVADASHLPSYRQLRIIRHDNIGEPTTLPAGAIAIFESTSLPSGWTRYSAQDGQYVRGENTSGTAGGNNTHSHSLSATIGNASGASHASRGGGTQVTGATAGHNHTASGSSSTIDSQPPFIEAVLAELGSAVAPPANMVAMWDEELPTGWQSRSGASDPYYQRFIKPANGFGATGGSITHSHENTSITTSTASAATNARSGTSGAAGSHTHTVTISSYNTVDHLPPYRDVVVGKKQEPSTYDQSSYRWFRNSNSTDVGLALAGQDTPAVSVGLPWRLRLSISVSDNDLGQSGESFKLQYAEQSGTCDASFTGETYTDLSTSSGILRYYDNSTPADADALTGNLNDPVPSSGTAQNQTYEENNNFSNGQSSIGNGDYGLWDFSLVDHSAPTDTTYCLRVVKADGSLLDDYSVIPEITTDDGSGHMVLLYAGGGTPTGWTCVSCNPGEPFYQRFAMGSESYGTTGGSATHSHAASASVSATTDSSGGSASTGTVVSALAHAHTATPDLDAASNLPSYRQLKFIRLDTAGVPDELPAGAIALFDDTVPTGWTRYSAQDGNYVRGENTVGSTGGSLTHSHNVSGSVSVAGGTTVGTGGGGPGSAGAGAGHTHTLSGTSASANHEPTFRQTILGSLDDDDSPPLDMIAFWDGTPPGAWEVLSDSGGAYHQTFVKPAATYGTTGGSADHNHANSTASTSGPSSSVGTQGNGSGAGSGHSHSVNISSVSTEDHLPPYIEVVIAKQTTPNTSPDVPADLSQYRTTLGTAILIGGYTDETQVQFRANLSDSDNPDTLELCVEVLPLSQSFTGADTACGTPVAYSGNPVAASVTVSGLANTEDYHWQVRTRDGVGAYSTWLAFGGNPENESDFSVDTVDPIGTVYDGSSTGVDVDLNDGSLSSLSANWDITDAGSGIDYFEFSIGTSPGNDDVSTWSNLAVATSHTVNSLDMRTSLVYFWNIRAVDNAGNGTIISSDGIMVAPTLQFSASPVAVDFDKLDAGNSYTDTKNSVLTTSTNAYRGYEIRAYAAAQPTSQNLHTINLFDGGTYVAPGPWLDGYTGYGYYSNDSSVQGGNPFGSVPCAGGGGPPPCWAPFSLAWPGDIVADHTDLITGSAVVDENYVVTHRITTGPNQSPGIYQTQVIYWATARY